MNSKIHFLINNAAAQLQKSPSEIAVIGSNSQWLRADTSVRPRIKWKSKAYKPTFQKFQKQPPISYFVDTIYGQQNYNFNLSRESILIVEMKKCKTT